MKLGGNIQGEAIVLDSFGITYEDQRNYKTALENFFKSLEIVRGRRKRIEERILLTKIGRIYKIQVFQEKALDYYLQGYNFIREQEILIENPFTNKP
ncbi:MAG: hypothetical protein GF308_07410 [Candidatus Heimdallarchaeota archaeon]|nr:hypothetical protein [Candidatus Heimdallarchaeota archaeon]